MSFKIANEISYRNAYKHEQQLREMQNKLDNKNQQLEDQLKLAEMIKEYYKNYVQTGYLFRATEIAKEYGMSAQTLNKILNKLEIIYPINGTWQIYQEYARFGYLIMKNDNGAIDVFWTEDGKLFIYVVLKQHNILPNKDNKVEIEKILDN